MRPLTLFEAHFRAAQGLLKVYRLLENESSATDDELARRLRGVLDITVDESVVLLFNDLLVGLVRERAETQPTFFKQLNLSLLLRQAVVSACTAMDVFFPALLEEYLPEVIRVKQRNWQPSDGDARALLSDFRLKVDELAGILEPETVAERWQLFSTRVLAHLRDKTLSNPRGIQATMTILGVDNPWQRIADRSGITANALRQQVQNLTSRRNDIIHRGDRPVGNTDGEPQPIDYAWANAHINAVNSTVAACDTLAREAVQALTAEVTAS